MTQKGPSRLISWLTGRGGKKSSLSDSTHPPEENGFPSDASGEPQPPDGPELQDPVAPHIEEAASAERPASQTNLLVDAGGTPSDGPTGPPTKRSLFARLAQGLAKTRNLLGSRLSSLFRGGEIDQELLEKLEEVLLMADVGIETTTKIINQLTKSMERKELSDPAALQSLLRTILTDMLRPLEAPLRVTTPRQAPYVILVIGVNGAGKTTTIGKIAHQLQKEGKSVMLAAGDTFRAAAVEQLKIWGKRLSIPVISQHDGADAAAVIFDAIQAAKARKFEVLIADTAGRLQNRVELMAELQKVIRVIKKLDLEAPHETMLVLDANTGQNAIRQVQLFHEAVGLSGITITKLDGTAKGGILFALADQLKIPVRYLGLGEQVDDLQPMDAQSFTTALFENNE